MMVSSLTSHCGHPITTSMKDCKLLIIRVCHQKRGVLNMCVKDTALSGLQWLGSLKPQFSFKS